MALNLDISKLTQSAAAKATPHDNCIVLDLGTGAFPRDIEVRLPDDDGARQNALWDGSLNLSVNDEVLCFEYSGISAWRVMAMGGNDSGAGQVRVSEVWESDFGAVALQADATGQIEIGKTTGPDAKLDILDTGGAQLRLTFEDGVKFGDLTVDTNHHLTIDPSSTGQIKLNATVTVIDEIQHEGDADTKIGFTDDVQTFTVGGEVLLTLTEAAQDVVKIGDGGDVDINFNDDMLLQGSDGFFGIGGTPSDRFHVLVDNAGAIRVATFENINTNVNSQVRLQMIKNSDAGTGFNKGGVLFHTTGGFGFANYEARNIRFLTGTVAGTVSDRMTIAPDGNIGMNGITSPSTELDIGNGAMEFDEMTAPGGGAANTCRIYAEDDGAGKTRFMAIFNTGAAQQIAIQP